MFSIQEQCSQFKNNVLGHFSLYTLYTLYILIFYDFLRYKYFYNISQTKGYPVNLFENLHILS